MDESQQITVFDILKTMTIDYYHYVDVVNVNHLISTQLMKKIAEPNEFVIVHSFGGDDIDAMVEYFKTDYDNEHKKVEE